MLNMDKHKISISFKSDRMHIYHYLKNTEGVKDNISAYICNLIEKDMCTPSPILLEDQVQKLVEHFLSAYSSNEIIPLKKEEPKEITNLEDIDLINNLF